MRRVKYALLVLLSVLIALLTGCLFAPAPPTGTIEGYVVDAGAGSPVVGATVKAFPMDDNGEPMYWVTTGYFNAMATTDAEGHYKLVLPKGRYVVVAEKDGYATSRVEGVVVASTAKLNIIEKPAFNPAWPLEPPEVTVTGVTEGGHYSGPISFKVDAHGPNDIRYIYVALGKTPGSSYLTAPRQIYESTYTTGDKTIDPAVYGVEGWTTFEVVVYDQNYNRTHVIYHIYVEPSTGPATIQPPANLKALAVTLGKKVSFYNEAMTVPSGRGDIEIHAAPEGGNLYVELTWNASPDDPSITGYHIYRRLAGEADYYLIGTVAAEGSQTASYTFRDASPDLQVGVETMYQVRAYRGDTESAAVEASTTPLDTWDVRLLEPADNATDVSLTPTFHWEPTKLVGKDQLYRVRIYDEVQGWWPLLSSGDPENLRNKTECTWDEIYVYSLAYDMWIPKEGTPWERLQPYRSYEWLIDFAVAYDDYDNPTAISIAVNNGAASEYLSVPATDYFQFTTGAQ